MEVGTTAYQSPCQIQAEKWTREVLENGKFERHMRNLSSGRTTSPVTIFLVSMTFSNDDTDALLDVTSVRDTFQDCFPDVIFQHWQVPDNQVATVWLKYNFAELWCPIEAASLHNRVLLVFHYAGNGRIGRDQLVFSGRIGEVNKCRVIPWDCVDAEIRIMLELHDLDALVVMDSCNVDWLTRRDSEPDRGYQLILSTRVGRFGKEYQMNSPSLTQRLIHEIRAQKQNGFRYFSPASVMQEFQVFSASPIFRRTYLIGTRPIKIPFICDKDNATAPELDPTYSTPKVIAVLGTCGNVRHAEASRILAHLKTFHATGLVEILATFTDPLQFLLRVDHDLGTALVALGVADFVIQNSEVTKNMIEAGCWSANHRIGTRRRRFEDNITTS